MKKKERYLCLLAVLFAFGALGMNAFGLDKHTWTGASIHTEPLLWSDPCNWDLERVPDDAANDWAQFNQPSTSANYPCVIRAPFVGSVQRTNFGLAQGDATVIMESGELTVTPGGLWINRNTAPGVNSSFYMEGGTFLVEGNLRVADNGNFASGDNVGTFEMSGGNFEATATSFIGDENGIGVLNMSGGVFKTNNLVVSDIAENATGMVTVDGGRIIINDALTVDDPCCPIDLRGGELAFVGDVVAGKAATAISNGDVIGHGGIKPVVAEYDADEDLTILASEFYFEPVPADGATGVDPELDLLGWTRPDPNEDNPTDVVSYELRFGTDPDPNVNPLVPVPENATSVAVVMDGLTSYTWKIAAYDEQVDPPTLIAEDVFTFSTRTANDPPVNIAIDAEPDFGVQKDGSGSLTLTGSFDDDNPSLVSVDWDVAPNDGNVTIVNEDQLVTAVDFSGLTEKTAYTFTMKLNDNDEWVGSEFEVSADVDIYPDGCTAAMDRGVPRMAGDLDYNCVVDLTDLSTFAGEWLESAALE